MPARLRRQHQRRQEVLEREIDVGDLDDLHRAALNTLHRRREASTFPHMQYFPIFLSLEGRRVLVVGDGEAATRKADALRRAGGVVTATPLFDPASLDGCALAIGADAPDADLLALSVAAQARGIPVNIVDRPALCSYITPSVIDRAPIAIAVSSGGAAPVLARLLRARIEAMVPPAFGRLAALADPLQRGNPGAFTRRGAAPPGAGTGAWRPSR